MAYSKTSNSHPEREIKYLNTTYNSIKSQLIDYAQTYFPDTVNDFSPSSPGTMFIEMVAYMGDILSFYQNTQLQETFLLLAQEKENLYNMAYSMGYRPKATKTASTYLDLFQLIPADPIRHSTPDMRYALELGEGSTFKSTAGPVFKIEQNVNFKVSSSLDPLDMSVYSVNEGNKKPEWYLLTKRVKAHAATRKSQTYSVGAYQKFLTLNLKDRNIIEIESIEDTDGNRYTEVPYLAQDTIFDDIENIAAADPDLHAYNSQTPYLLRLKRVPRRFITRLKSDNTMEIQFGAGENGGIDEEIIPNPDNIGLGLKEGLKKLDHAYDPSNFLYTGTYGIVPSNTTITVTYFVNEFGINANVIANSITQAEFLDIKNRPDLNKTLFNYVRNSVASSNPEPATGGGPGDTVQEIRNNAMATFSSQNRTVTKEDYLVRTLSMPPKFGAIAKAYITQDDQISPLVTGPNQIPNPLALNLYVLAYNQNKRLTKASRATKENLSTYLEQHRMLTDAINIKDAFYINIGLEFEIVTFKNFNNEDVLRDCIDSLKRYFDIDRWQINQPIIISEIYNAIGEVTGVQSVPKVTIDNLVGVEKGYSPFKYDLEDATLKGIIYPSLDPSIFEIRFPNRDIKGRVIQY
jgi:hypothetical protein